MSMIPNTSEPKPGATIRVACPKCGAVLSVSADARGRCVKCGSCAGLLKVPAARGAGR